MSHSFDFGNGEVEITVNHVSGPEGYRLFVAHSRLAGKIHEMELNGLHKIIFNGRNQSLKTLFLIPTPEHRDVWTGMGRAVGYHDKNVTPEPPKDLSFIWFEFSQDASSFGVRLHNPIYEGRMDDTQCLHYVTPLLATAYVFSQDPKNFHRMGV